MTALFIPYSRSLSPFGQRGEARGEEARRWNLHNSRGRQDYIMMVEAADGDWVSTHMVDGEQK
jgi:hypothetical protein